MSRKSPWLELLRLPNLFTVPGDILVGWCLGGFQSVCPWWGLLASLCLYSAGLLFNDLFDERIDAKERPTRPLPSGRVTRLEVGGVAVLLSLLGVVSAGPGWKVALALLVLILLYDGGIKKIPCLGVVNMGLCRAVNLLLGFACAFPYGTQLHLPMPLVWAMLFFFVYIVVVSVAAKHEAEKDLRLKQWLRWSPGILVLFLVPLFWILGTSLMMLVWALLAAAWLVPTLLLRRSIPGYVGALIRHLIPLQLLWCMTTAAQGSWVLVISLLLCWAAACLSARRYAGS